jgi:RimJ/RimL family protein N-acetyltransferase
MSTPRTIVHLLPTDVEGPTVLRDGTSVLVRAALPRDRHLLEVFARGLSPDALRLRFFRAAPPESVPGEALTEGTVGDRLSLLVFRQEGPDLHVVGHGEYVRDRPESRSAEVAFLVADRYRHRGVATLLILRLARAARVFGIREFESEVLPENQEMIDVFRGVGFPVQIRWTGKTCRITFPIVEEPRPTRSPANERGSLQFQRDGIRA